MLKSPSECSLSACSCRVRRGSLSAPRVQAAPAAPAAVPAPVVWRDALKLMTLSDTARAAVKWAPSTTSIADVAKVAAPAKIRSARTTPFQKQVWQLSAVIDRYRIQSNGEIALVLFDAGSSTYMNAYLPSSQCLPKRARGRARCLQRGQTRSRAARPRPATGSRSASPNSGRRGRFLEQGAHDEGRTADRRRAAAGDRLKVLSGCGENHECSGRASSSRSTSSLVVYAATEIRSRSLLRPHGGNLDAVLVPRARGVAPCVDVVGYAHGRHLEHHLLGGDRLGSEHSAQVAGRLAAELHAPGTHRVPVVLGLEGNRRREP